MSITGLMQDMDVLIVEDEFMIALGIEKTFLDAGAQSVSIYGKISDAWSAVTTTHFDFALLDIRLPDGLSFPLAIDLFSKGMPVVMHSGHAEIYDSARLPGIVFCPKPATPSELVRASLNARQFMMNPQASLLEETLH